MQTIWNGGKTNSYRSTPFPDCMITELTFKKVASTTALRSHYAIICDAIRRCSICPLDVWIRDSYSKIHNYLHTFVPVLSPRLQGIKGVSFVRKPNCGSYYESLF